MPSAAVMAPKRGGRCADTSSLFCFSFEEKSFSAAIALGCVVGDDEVLENEEEDEEVGVGEV